MAADSLKETLIALEKQSWEAWKGGDGGFYRSFLSEDHLEVGYGGIAGKGQVAAFVGSHRCAVKSYAVRDFKVTAFNACTAALTYYAQQDTTCGGKGVPSPAWVTSLYVRRKGRWLNALYQQTPAQG